MNESLIKADCRGRLRYTSDQKKTMVDAYHTSGLSAPRFATLHGVNYQTLVSWIKKDKMAESAEGSRSAHPALFSLVAAEIESSSTIGATISAQSGALEVLLPSGTILHLSSPSQIDLAVILIHKLQNSRPC